MRTTLLFLLACAIALPTIALAQQEQPFNRIQASFSQPVTISKDLTLQPGQYVFKQIRTQSHQPNVFRIEDPSSGKMIGVTPPPSEAVWKTANTGQAPPHNQIVLKQIGSTQYLDYIWFQGVQRGYHFAVAPKGEGQEVVVDENGNTGQQAKQE
jgi:hypothetical protein